jgi:transcription elongation factor GreA
MGDKVLSKKVFEVLVKHLVDTEEKKDQVLEKYYPEITKERKDFQDFVEDYIKKVEQRIYSAKVVENNKEICPFVIIGSIVELENLEDQEIEKYHIVFPFENNSSTKIDFASFLSPVGKALLLKKAEDIITIKNPMGKLTYSIKSIEIPDEMFSFTG